MLTRGYVALLAAGAAACCLFPMLAGCGRLAMETAGAADAVQSPETVRVERGVFRRTVRLHGTVEAVQSFIVRAPRLAGQTTPTMVITRLIPNGARVHKGDILVELDRQSQMKNVLDREAEYEGLVEQIKKKNADRAAALARDETELLAAQVDLQSARVDMRTNELVSRIQAEINRQNLAQAEAKLKLVEDTQALKRDAAEAELRILEIQRDRAGAAMLHAKANIEQMTLRSPLDGLVVLSPIYKGSRYVDPQEGDEVRPGASLLKVVDPAAMQVRARVNQVDLSFLEVGAPVEVRLDAYPDLVLPGRVEHVGAVGVASNYTQWIRSFPALISIQGRDPKLLPDLTAAADVQVEKLQDVLLLPREAVVLDQNLGTLEIVTPGGTERRSVEIGGINECQVAITSGVEEGTIVLLNPGTVESVRRPPQ